MNKVIIASGPVIIEDGKALLNKHKDPFWKFCGGKAEGNESLWETAQREAREEMGIGIEKIKEEPFFLYVSKQIEEGVVDVILVHWLCKRVGEVLPAKEIEEWNWHPIDSLPDDIGPNIRPAIVHFTKER